MTREEILNLPMEENDAEAKTIRGYLKALLTELWIEEEGFSGKRPFGNSGWTADIYRTLVVNEVVRGRLDEDGYLDQCDTKSADAIVLDAIDAL